MRSFFTPYGPKGKLKPEILAILRKIWPDMSDKISFDELHRLTQLLIFRNEKLGGGHAPRSVSKPSVTFPDGEDTAALIELFRVAGFVDRVIDIPFPNPAYGIFTGKPARLQRIQTRLAADLWSRAYLQPGMLIYMGGQPLDPKKSMLRMLIAKKPGTGYVLPIRFNWPRPAELVGTSTYLNWLVWGQSLLPHGMDLIVPIYVSGSPAAPHATVRVADQVAAWLAEHQPEPGRVVIYTVQPNFALDDMIWRRLLEPLGFTVFTVAASALTSRHEPAYLADALARAIHEAWKFWREIQ